LENDDSIGLFSLIVVFSVTTAFQQAQTVYTNLL